VEEWRSGGVEEWRSGGVEEWRSGGAASGSRINILKSATTIMLVSVTKVSVSAPCPSVGI
jgi:hypothetical protein